MGNTQNRNAGAAIPQTTYTKQQLWAELEALGEDTVRERLLTKVYGDVGDKRALVQEWLRLKEQARTDARHAEQVEISRSGKNAAWAAAIIAALAAIIAAVAAGFSYMALGALAHAARTAAGGAFFRVARCLG